MPLSNHKKRQFNKYSHKEYKQLEIAIGWKLFWTLEKLFLQSGADKKKPTNKTNSQTTKQNNIKQKKAPPLLQSCS